MAHDRERLELVASLLAAVFDGQMVKTTEAGGPWAIMSAKRSTAASGTPLADTYGRGLVFQAHPASVQDRHGTPPLLEASRALYPFGVPPSLIAATPQTVSPAPPAFRSELSSSPPVRSGSPSTSGGG